MYTVVLQSCTAALILACEADFAVSARAGNVAPKGEGLDDNDGLCTWLSTDGGATWDDVASGGYIYEYADWGGILIMAKHTVSGPANEVGSLVQVTGPLTCKRWYMHHSVELRVCEHSCQILCLLHSICLLKFCGNGFFYAFCCACQMV